MRGSYRGKCKDNVRKRGEKQNPIDRNTGEILRCDICRSIFYFVWDCPDVSGFPKKKNEIKLQYYTEEVFHTLKLVSKFYQNFIFHQMIALQKYEKYFLFHLKSSFCSWDNQMFVFLSSPFLPVSHCFVGWSKKNL